MSLYCLCWSPLKILRIIAVVILIITLITGEFLGNEQRSDECVRAQESKRKDVNKLKVLEFTFKEFGIIYSCSIQPSKHSQKCECSKTGHSKNSFCHCGVFDSNRKCMSNHTRKKINSRIFLRIVTWYSLFVSNAHRLFCSLDCFTGDRIWCRNDTNRHFFLLNIL